VLAIEVISPSTARTDRQRKRMLYQRYGVETYWIVDGRTKTIEVWHPGDVSPAVVTDELRWQITSESPECIINVAAMFHEVQE
jgi:Uma2 family endonuclease